MIDNNLVISAQLILRPLSGKHIRDAPGIRVENLSDYIPNKEDITTVSKILQSKGFEIGPLVGISFSITSSVKNFEKYFGVTLHQGEKGDIEFLVGQNMSVKELPDDNMPEELKNYVETITFPPIPDFGPTKF